MKKREPVSSIMTKSVVTAQLNNDNLRTIKEEFKNHRIRHIPVMNGHDLVGIVSKNDLMRLSFGNLFDGQDAADEAIFDMLSIEQVMTQHPTTISPETEIRDVAKIFVEQDFHSLPVVENNELKGIVTSTDVLEYMLSQY
jgi:CBS domain-containing protein